MCVKIAKYRKEGFPGEWYLTDFTMNQVEGRMDLLEEELNREIEHSRFLEKLLEVLLGEQFDKITLFDVSKLNILIKKVENNKKIDIEE